MKPIALPIHCLLPLTALMAFIGTGGAGAAPQPADDALPLVGTGGHGHTYPGATVPFGYVQVSPDTRTEGWDTYRAEHPLMTLVQPGRVNDFVQSMLAFYQQSEQHALPMWPLACCETWCMIGYHSRLERPGPLPAKPRQRSVCDRQSDPGEGNHPS